MILEGRTSFILRNGTSLNHDCETKLKENKIKTTFEKQFPKNV